MINGVIAEIGGRGAFPSDVGNIELSCSLTQVGA
jgi:hypothetical protein